MNKIVELQNRLVELQEDSQTISARAEAEGRDLTEEESADLKRIFADFDHAKIQLEQLMQIERNAAALNEPAGRRTTADGPDADDDDPPAATDRQVRPQNSDRPAPDQTQRRVYPVPRRDSGDGGGLANNLNRAERGRWGWDSLGHMCLAAMHARTGRGMDNRLNPRNAPTEWASESVGADGGFAVPPDFRTAIMSKVFEETGLFGRTDQQQSSSNSTTWPLDTDAPWQSATGISVGQVAEAGAIGQSKPALDQLQVTLHKEGALIYITDELLEDAAALDGYLRRKVPEKITSRLNNLIVRGSGSGEMEGILESAALITVAAEASQVADTIMFENVIKMYNRMYSEYRAPAVWLINQDIEPQLFSMQFVVKNVLGTENVGGVPVYLPANSLSGSPFATLLGKPLIPVQACSTLGDLGDIIFASLPQFLTVRKTSGLRIDTSIHVAFEQDLMAFRFLLRVGGASWLPAPISPQFGTNTMSAFVTLAERS